MPAGMTMFQGMLFPSGPIPVLGNLGAATTTVAIAESLAVRPLASPLAVMVFTVVLVSLAEQVYVQVSVASSFESLFTSPEIYFTGLHLSSVRRTLLNATVPGLVTLLV